MAVALDVTEPRQLRFTVDEFMRIAEVLNLERCELIDGVIYDVAPETSGHIDAVVEVFDLLRARYPNLRVRPGGSVRIDGDVAWTPDVSVFKASDEPPAAIPDASTLALVVEIAVSSWYHDTGVKLAGYARNGVPEYWVLRPVAPGWELTRFTEPEGSSYRRRVTVPLTRPGAIPAR